MYHFQLTTSDFELQLLTECTASTLEQLLYLAKIKIAKNKSAVGAKFRVFLNGKMIKESYIRG